MKEDVLKILQHYFFDYIVDKTYVRNISRVSLEIDNINNYNLIKEGDCIEISPFYSQNVYLKNTVEPAFEGEDKQTKYIDLINEKVFIKYYGNNADWKLRDIVNQKRIENSDANNFLENNEVSLNYIGKLKNVKIKINNDFIHCAIQEAILQYKNVSFDNKKFKKIIDAEVLIKH